MTKLILIFLGSGLGGVLRYALSGWVQAATTESFPTGTLAVNVIGCLAIGFLSAAFEGSVLIREEHRIAIIIGILGGFTTFSAFGKETFALAADREMMWAILNVLLSVGFGLASVWLGTRLAERIYGASW
ncbi:MAG: fluoride efflux transporter CrcB [Phycisphaerales bacterium]|nr:fluoride efflux transporter CrcB [Phycisphaerales bacterium]MCI0632049.1 fluoride efflux transporter CrcB [Phycisphaerales bacterium]